MKEQDLTFEQLDLLVEHEKYHEIFKKKHEEKTERERIAFNVATDMAINEALFPDQEKPKFMSFAEATAWAMEQVENTRPGEVIAKFNVETEKELVVESKEEFKNFLTKEMEYQNWLFEAGEFQKKLEVILDSAQDLWIAGEQFKSWLIKKDGQWFDVERSMQQVYSHIDSALHFLRIIREEDSK